MIDTIITLAISGTTFFAIPEPTFRAQISHNANCELWQVERNVCNDRLALRNAVIEETNNALSNALDNAERWRVSYSLEAKQGKAKDKQIKRLQRRVKLQKWLTPLVGGGGLLTGIIVGVYAVK